MIGGFYYLKKMEQEPINLVKVISTLTKEENRILEMYSRGESYEVIQENLRQEYGMNYSNKKLGHKMGEIKKKMNCETQFQMGYIYGTIEREILTPKEKIHIIQDPDEYHKGINHGLAMSTFFWLTIYALISHFIK